MRKPHIQNAERVREILVPHSIRQAETMLKSVEIRSEKFADALTAVSLMLHKYHGVPCLSLHKTGTGEWYEDIQEWLANIHAALDDSKVH